MPTEATTPIAGSGSRYHPVPAWMLAMALCASGAPCAAQTGTWSAPQVLHVGNPTELIEVDAAIDDAARVQIVHARHTTNPSTRSVWASQWTGSHWTAAQSLSTARLALNPAVALDPLGGQGYVTWGDYDELLLTTTIAEKQFDGQQWLAQATPAWGMAGESYEGYNLLAADRSGRTFALYQMFVGGRTRAAAAVRTGGGWSAGTRLSNQSGEWASVDPALAVNAAGLAAAAWVDVEVFSGESRLYVALGTSAGWGAPQRMAFDTNSPANVARVAVADDGQAFVVWYEVAGLISHSYYSHYDGSQWSAPARLDHLASSASSPDVAVGAGGDAWAIYTQETETPGATGVWARRWTGGTWSAPVMVNESSLGFLIAGPRVVVDQAGRVLVVYFAFDSFNTFKVLYYSYGHGGGWEEGLVDAGATGQNRLKRLVMNRNGHAVAVWDKAASTAQGVPHDLLAARFTPPPADAVFEDGFDGPP